MIVITGNLGILAKLYPSLFMLKIIPDSKTFPVIKISAFDLVRCSSDSP